MDTPFTVTLDLYRGHALRPFRRMVTTVLASSALDACSLAECSLNIELPDIEYAAATEALPVWEPRPAQQVQPVQRPMLSLAA